MDGSNSNCTCTCFLAGLMVILAFACFMTTQVHIAWRGEKRLTEQNQQLTAQIEQMNNQVLMSQQWQTMLEGICNDLLEMRGSDSDLRKVVDKYQIRKNELPRSPDSGPATETR